MGLRDRFPILLFLFAFSFLSELFELTFQPLGGRLGLEVCGKSLLFTPGDRNEQRSAVFAVVRGREFGNLPVDELGKGC